MARRFNGTSDYLEHGAAVVTAVPITMACWFKAATSVNAAFRALIAIGDVAADTRVQLMLSTTGPLQAGTVAIGGVGANVSSSSNHKAGMWNHGTGIFVTSTDRRVFLNGIKSTSATSVVLGTPTAMSMGARYIGGVRGSYMDGLIAEVAIWNVALDDADVYLLSRGYYPDQIRPGSLKAYWDLEGQYSPNEIDRKGRFDATVFGAKPAMADHPPMIPCHRRSRALDCAAWQVPVAFDMVPARRQQGNRAAMR